MTSHSPSWTIRVPICSNHFPTISNKELLPIPHGTSPPPKSRTISTPSPSNHLTHNVVHPMPICRVSFIITSYHVVSQTTTANRGLYIQEARPSKILLPSPHLQPSQRISQLHQDQSKYSLQECCATLLTTAVTTRK